MGQEGGEEDGATHFMAQWKGKLTLFRLGIGTVRGIPLLSVN